MKDIHERHYFKKIVLLLIDNVSGIMFAILRNNMELEEVYQRMEIP